jgi:hypothetical protein
MNCASNSRSVRRNSARHASKLRRAKPRSPPRRRTRRRRKKFSPNRNQLHEQTLRDAKAAQEKALADLRDTFKALSADALKQSAPEFLRLAEQSFGKFQETAKGDLGAAAGSHQRLGRAAQAAVGNLPENLQQSSAAQSGALGEVKKHLETLAQSNATLARRRSSSGWCCTRIRRAAMGRGNAAARGRGGGHERALRFHGADFIRAKTVRTSS